MFGKYPVGLGKIGHALHSEGWRDIRYLIFYQPAYMGYGSEHVAARWKMNMSVLLDDLGEKLTDIGLIQTHFNPLKFMIIVRGKDRVWRGYDIEHYKQPQPILACEFKNKYTIPDLDSGRRDNFVWLLRTPDVSWPKRVFNFLKKVLIP